MKTRIREKFKTLFGAEGEVFASAGRINLIGEHTDYNGDRKSTRLNSSHTS